MGGIATCHGFLKHDELYLIGYNDKKRLNFNQIADLIEKEYPQL